MEDKKKPVDRQHEAGWGDHLSFADECYGMGGHFMSEGPHCWQEEATAANRKTEHEPYLTEGEVVEAEMPELRKGQYADVAGRVRKIKLNQEEEPAYEPRDVYKDMCVTAGVAKKTAEPKKKQKTEPLTPLAERYKNAPQGSIRKIWADTEQKHSSGLPVYLQRLLEGIEDDYETEILKYNKLAGSKFKTTKQKVKEEIVRIQKDNAELTKMLAAMTKKLDGMTALLNLNTVEMAE